MRLLLFAFGSGGLWHYASSLVRGLLHDERLERVTVVTSQENNLTLVPRDNPRLQLQSVRAPHRVPGFLRWSVDWRAQRELRRLWREARPDVIHITDTYPIYPRYHDLLRQTPLVFTHHDPIMHRGESWRHMTHALQWYVARQSALVIVHGESLKQMAIARRGIPSRKVAVVPMGIHDVLLNGTVTAEAADPQRILFFGRVRAYKGLDVLLESLQLLQQQGVPFQVTVAGEGDLAPHASALAAIGNKLILNHYIPDAEVGQLFARHAVVALPYHEATQSGIASLALATGKAIVATKAGALPELLHDEENALLVSPSDPQQFALALKRVLVDATLREQLQRGARKLAQRLNWHDIARTHVSLYESIR